MKLLVCVCAITLIVSISISNIHSTEAAGFSIDLFHRDSLRSPSLDSLSYENVGATLKRSFLRSKTLTQPNIPDSASVDIIPDRGEYLMRFALGTPKVEALAIADTGSDLTWIQCLPCKQCFKQKQPFFAPNRSSTYKTVSCRSTTCDSVQSTFCNRASGTCRYMIVYGDQSYSQGEVATETITLGSAGGKGKPVAIPNVIVGCGHVDQGTFADGTSGIVGLGGGKESLIRQMGSSIGGKFSYCLVPLLGRTTNPSKMHFGDEAVVSGAGVVTTPIVPKSPATFYYLTLEGVSVGSSRIFGMMDSPSWSEKAGAGNIIIDSGTTLTYLPGQIYSQIEAAVIRQIPLKRTGDPLKQLSLCYLATGDADEKKVPEITVHFKGADVKLKSYNTFVRTSKNSLCFAFAPSTFMPIYGNLAQMNFLVGYDLEKKTVSFKPTDCAKA